MLDPINATYRDGAILPDVPLDLPNNTPVRVVVVAERPSAAQTSNLGSDLRRLREQIVASGALLLDEADLDRERAERRGEKPAAE